MDKRYQVFVSSTYEDLKEERQAVIQALLELNCIPAGMELFPAADDDQQTLIKKVIDDCDYYLVVVGGRYGALSPSGISYTRMEYEYAVSIGKPAIGFIHKNPGSIPAEKTELSEEGRTKLNSFRDLVQQKMCKYWTTPHDLAAAVSTSLVKLKEEKPAIGWVRGDESSQAMSGPTSSHIKSVMRAVGIKQIYLNRSGINYVEFILKAKASSEIKMLGITMRDLQAHDVRTAMEKKLKAGCKIKILLLDRNSKFLKVRANDEIRGTKRWRNWQSWKREVVEFNDLHQRYINNLPPELQRNIKLAHFDALPVFSIFMNGKTMVVGFYVSGKLGGSSPHLEIEVKRGNISSAFDDYFDSLWPSGK
jgi:uncharacterized protein DUF4062